MPSAINSNRNRDIINEDNKLTNQLNTINSIRDQLKEFSDDYFPDDKELKAFIEQEPISEEYRNNYTKYREEAVKGKWKSFYRLMNKELSRLQKHKLKLQLIKSDYGDKIAPVKAVLEGKIIEEKAAEEKITLNQRIQEELKK